MNGTPSLIEKRFDRLARPVLSLGEHLERLDDLLHEEAGDGLVRVGRGLHVLGDKMPRVGHRAAVRLLGGLEDFGRDLGQALAASGFPMATIQEEILSWCNYCNSKRLKKSPK